MLIVANRLIVKYKATMSKLNPRQLEALNHTQGPLLVLAGAGSGKTSVITQKIAHLIENCRIPADRITAVTLQIKRRVR